MTQYNILSTKNLDPVIVDSILQKGMDIMEQEFIAVRPIATSATKKAIQQWAAYAGNLAVVFTSQYGYRNTAKHLSHRHSQDAPGWKIFCLSGATRKAIVEEGLFEESAIVATADNAIELANTLIKAGPFEQVVFFCGKSRRNELPDLLKENGINLTEVVVYETVETPEVITDIFDAVLFFSPSAVKSFFSVNILPKETTCFAIGPTTAAAIREATDNRIITSEEPNQETLLADVSYYLQHKDQYQ